MSELAKVLGLLASAAQQDEQARTQLTSQLEDLQRKLAEISGQAANLASSIKGNLPAPVPAAVAEAQVVQLADKKKQKAAAGKKPAAAAAAAAPAATPKAKGKGGKKTAAAATAAPEKAAAAKPAKTAKTAAVKAEKPRVAGDDKMPPLHERLRIVIGNDEVTIPDAIERLRARDESWVPESKELKAYISLALSTHTKDLFQRVKRGVYKCRTGAAPAAPTEKVEKVEKTKAAKPKKAVTAAKTNGTHNPSNGAAETDESDNNILNNPFTPVAA